MNDTVKRAASLQALLQFPQFSALDQAELQQLLRRSTVETVPAGRMLFKPGVCEEQRLFLLAGEVALLSDQRTADHVCAGSRAAEQELGSERPRQLWGWSKTRVEVLWVDAPPPQTRDAEVVSQPSESAPTAATEPSPCFEQNDTPSAWQQALETAQAERARAEEHVRQLQLRVTELEQALQQAQEHTQAQNRKRHHAPGPAAPSEPPSQSPAPATVADRAAAVMVACTPGDDDIDLPSLRPRASRGVPASEEIDDLLSAWDAPRA